jgi:hypothetical protein
MQCDSFNNNISKQNESRTTNHIHVELSIFVLRFSFGIQW